MMASWQAFAEAAPEMAAIGLRLLEKHGLAYLATVRKDGAPRAHPVCPFIGRGRLFVATAPTSPKRFDLLRDGSHGILGERRTAKHTAGSTALAPVTGRDLRSPNVMGSGRSGGVSCSERAQRYGDE